MILSIYFSADTFAQVNHTVHADSYPLSHSSHTSPFVIRLELHLMSSH